MCKLKIVLNIMKCFLNSAGHMLVEIYTQPPYLWRGNMFIERSYLTHCVRVRWVF